MCSAVETIKLGIKQSYLTTVSSVVSTESSCLNFLGTRPMILVAKVGSAS
jgi:hypothetical protein